MIGESAALGAAICWVFSAVLYKRALADSEPLSANTVRCLETSLALTLAFVFVGKFWVMTALPLQVLVMACVSGVVGMGLGDTLYMISLKILGVSRAVPITCTYPLFSLVWASLIVGETITFQVVLGVFAIVFGIWLLSIEKPDKNVEDKDSKLRVKGVIFAISTAIAWSISISLVNLAVQETTSFEQAYAINAIRITAVAISLLVYAFISKRKLDFLKVKAKTAVTLLTGGLIAIGLGWFLLTLSFLYIPEAQAVPISSTTPLFSTLMGIAFLREKVTTKIAVGSVMVVLGIFLIFIV
ncbi:DMT family transporter [Candidatus Bathyarchaeota archaeon]|nr:DMT family transporter [Candidatus Bathyarchaeota archaeon]